MYFMSFLASVEQVDGKTRKETAHYSDTLLALLLALLICAPQPSRAQAKAPPMSGSYESVYGVPEPMQLEEIARGVGHYERKTVRTKVVMDYFAGEYYLLKGPGAAKVLGISVAELSSEMNSFLGRDVEIVGLVRRIPDHQTSFPICGPESKCNDPLLPALPNRQGTMPVQSITIWKIVDLTEPGGTGTTGGYLTIESLVLRPGRHDNQTIRVIGQFRGGNLYGDMPANSERSPADWVIKDGPYAVWVTGKRPKGSGWSLDVMLKSDAGRWIEVRGKPETVDGVTYLKAQELRLTKGPTSTSPE
jgi:hypothetical protein